MTETIFTPQTGTLTVTQTAPKVVGVSEADAQPDAEAHTGNADSRKLAKDWLNGKGNTKDRNFVTPGDEADPRTVEEVLADKGMEPAFTGKY